MIVILITGQNHERLAWRLIIGLGCIPPLSLIYARWKLQEPEAFNRQSMKKAPTPWGLVIRFYWPRLLAVAAIWFIYDFCSYGFGYYSSTITDTVAPKGSPLWKVFGWNTVINAFYVPGALLGSVIADWIGPRKTLVAGVLCQAIVGFVMAGLYNTLSKSEHIAAFAVVYGIFLSLGELGPGDNVSFSSSPILSRIPLTRHRSVCSPPKPAPLLSAANTTESPVCPPLSSPLQEYPNSYSSQPQPVKSAHTSPSGCFLISRAHTPFPITKISFGFLLRLRFSLAHWLGSLFLRLGKIVLILRIRDLEIILARMGMMLVCWGFEFE